MATRGRHRRPSKAVPVLATAGIAAGSFAIAASTSSAYAASITPLAGSVPRYPAHQVQAAEVVKVAPGDTLSGLAQEYCADPADWTGIYAANRDVLSNPDQIVPGEILTVSCRTVQAPAVVTLTAEVSTAGMGSFQQCVIARESGGDPGIWNASGHWGLYQFAYSTWVAHGGPPAEFGTASAAEQTRVFWSTVAEDGTSDWAPWDHCL